jgi:hypothetical protein
MSDEDLGTLEYKVVEGSRADLLEDQLNELSKDGWVIEGSPAILGTSIVVILVRARVDEDGDGGDDAQPPIDEDNDDQAEGGRGYLQ